jgi:hypothetical protein
MSKEGSVWPLLIVALLALGLMLFVSFDRASAIQAIGGGQPIGVGQGAVYNPIREESQVYQIQAGVASQSTQMQMMVQDLLQAYLEINCPGQTDKEVVDICHKYAVSVR